MQYRFFSDIHLERDVSRVKRPTLGNLWQPVPLNSDKDTVLIIPGDIWNGIRPLQYAAISWLGDLSTKFKAVVFVLGNHDYWGEHLTALPSKLRTKLAQAGLANVHFLELADGTELGSVVIDGVRLVGGTLWTNMNRGDPTVTTKFDFDRDLSGKPVWNDRNLIKSGGYAKFGSRAWLNRHISTVANLRKALQVGDEPIIWVSHHAPCLISAPPEDGDALASYLYASDLSELILDNPRIKVALHGHTHRAYDYMVGDYTRVRCNPRGYAPSDLVSGFDPEALGTVTGF